MIAKSTVSLVEGLLRPLANTGAIHRSEVKAVVTLLHSAANGQNKPRERQQMLTRKEAAQRLRLSSKTVSRMIAAGELEARYLRKRSPRTLRIPSSSLERFETGHDD